MPTMIDASKNLRRQIRDEVAAIAPHDDLEKSVITDTLAWIDAGTEIFRREKPATPPKHLVSYFLLVDGDYILLVDHIKAELWLPSGGHVESNEHPRTTVEREIVEELGIKANFAYPEPQFITATTTVGKTAGHVDVSLWYLVLGDRFQQLEFDRDEFARVRWFHRSDVPFKRSDPELRRFLEKVS